MSNVGVVVGARLPACRFTAIWASVPLEPTVSTGSPEALKTAVPVGSADRVTLRGGVAALAAPTPAMLIAPNNTARLAPGARKYFLILFLTSAIFHVLSPHRCFQCTLILRFRCVKWKSSFAVESGKRKALRIGIPNSTQFPLVMLSELVVHCPITAGTPSAGRVVGVLLAAALALADLGRLVLG